MKNKLIIGLLIGSTVLVPTSAFASQQRQEVISSHVFDIAPDVFFNGNISQIIETTKVPQLVSKGTQFIGKPVLVFTPDGIENTDEHFSIMMGIDENVPEDLIVSLQGSWSINEDVSTIVDWIDMNKISQEIIFDKEEAGIYYYHVKAELNTGDSVYYKTGAFNYNPINIALVEATLAVEKAEGSLLQVDHDTAKALVDVLPEIEERQALLDRLIVVQDKINFKAQLDQAVQAVVQAEMSKTQGDVDSARILVNELPEGEDKTLLTERLDVIQGEIDFNTIKEATGAVEKAESTKEQADLDEALNLVNKLPNSLEKDDLLDRLENLQDKINADNLLKEATKAVENAELTKDQSDLNKALDIVSTLPNGSEKDDLLGRLESLQDKINADKVLKEATEAVEKAESTKSQIDLNTAKDLVSKLPNSIEKTELETRLKALESEINENKLFLEALKAVEEAESTKKQVDVDNARVLVNKLSEGQNKTDLHARLDKVQEEITKQSMLDKIAEIENKLNNDNLSKEDIEEIIDELNEIKDIVNDLPNSGGPDFGGLDDVKNDANSKYEKMLEAIEQAKLAVEKAENTLTQVDHDSAKVLVTVLPACLEKTDFINRLEVVQEKINLKQQFKVAIESVEKAESTLTQVDHDSAKLLVTALPSGVEQTDLINRLKTVQDKINLKQQIEVVGKAVEKAESTLTQVDHDSAKVLVTELPSCEEQTDFINRLKVVQDKITLKQQIKVATEAVEKAETTLTQIDHDSAKALVTALPTGTEQIDLTNRLKVVQDKINLKQNIETAREAVEKAETTLIQVDHDSAKLLVTALPECTEKTNFINRLKVVQDKINLKQNIQIAKLAVEKAESTLTQVDHDSANALVTDLPSCEEKPDFINRLKVVQDQINLKQNIEVARKAVEQAEVLVTQDALNIANSKVALLPNCPEKIEFEQRLSVVKDKIALNVLIADATKAVEDAEKDKTSTSVIIARAKVEKLPNGVIKTNLNARLDAIEADIEESDNALNEAIKAVEKAEKTVQQVDVDNARALVNNLPAGSNKTSLSKRLDTVQKLINQQIQDKKLLQEAIQAVEKVEATLNISDLYDATAKVNKLPAGQDKIDLSQRLREVEIKINQQIELNKQEKDASQKVDLFEKFPREPYLTQAKEAVNKLPEGIVKAQFEERIQAVLEAQNQDSAKDIKTVETSLSLAQKYKREPYFTRAEEAIAKLKQESNRIKYTEQLNEIRGTLSVKMSPELKGATNIILMAEKSPTSSLIRKAEISLYNLENSPEKAVLQSRLNVVKYRKVK